MGSNSLYLGDDEALERKAVIDWSKFNLAKQAFQTCETDGEEGLTWDEVDSCEVRSCKITWSFRAIHTFEFGGLNCQKCFQKSKAYKCDKNNYDSRN